MTSSRWRISPIAILVFLLTTAASWFCLQATTGSFSQFEQTRAIESVRVGDRVKGTNPTGEFDSSLGVIDSATWKKITFCARKTNGTQVVATLLRPAWWVESHDIEKGKSCELSLPQFGVDQQADVISIEECPTIRPGAGSVVTGTFRHTAAEILELSIEGEPNSIGTTPNHPFWSEDRQEFVPASSLEFGEQVRTRSGTRRVTGIERSQLPTVVFNLEVAGEHVYLVGTQGILVHNDCLEVLKALGANNRQIAEFQKLVANNARITEKVQFLQNQFGIKNRKEAIRRLKEMGLPAPRVVGGPAVLQANKMGTIRLSASNWRKTTQFADGDDLVYVLRDADTGEFLKVGKSAADLNKAGKAPIFHGRFGPYAKAGRRTNRNLELDVWAFGKSEGFSAELIESQMRTTLINQGHALPWDNTIINGVRRLGRDGPGVPGASIPRALRDLFKWDYNLETLVPK